MAQPKKPANEKMKQIALRMTEAQHLRIKAAAKKAKVTVAQWVRAACGLTLLALMGCRHNATTGCDIKDIAKDGAHEPVAIGTVAYIGATPYKCVAKNIWKHVDADAPVKQ